MIDYASFLRPNSFAIFLVHGVIREQRFEVRNYTNKHLLLDRFAAILRQLSDRGEPVSMDEIVHATTNGEALPDRAFAITFDDGFENNYSMAAPVLQQFNVPATFYITTGFIEDNKASWTDIIEDAIERTPSVQLNLSFLPKDQSYATPSQKIELLDQIRSFVKTNRGIDPYEFASDICRQLQIETMNPEPDLDQKMSWDQVRALSEERLFTIGGHSHTHRILSFLEEQQLEYELSTSLEKLQTQLDQRIEHYSYPEGLEHCYSDHVIGQLKNFGIRCAPTAETGMNEVGDDLFRLKRITVV